MVKIYTKKGDRGLTRLFDGTPVRKDDRRVGAYGDVDELNAAVGLARSLLDPRVLEDLRIALEGVQRDLFALGALLADPRRDGATEVAAADRLALGGDRVERLERLVDGWESELPALTNFILPAGSSAAAALHVARVVARRAERSVVAVVEEGVATPLAVTYLNRLSDFLFVAARLANHRAGVADEPW